MQAWANTVREIGTAPLLDARESTDFIHLHTDLTPFAEFAHAPHQGVGKMNSVFNLSVKVSAIAGMSLFLSGCMLDNMEKITEETKNEVHATNEAIHQTEDLAKIARMHDNMVNPSISKSVRVNAAKAVLAKWPESQLASDLGFLAPYFRMGAIKTSIGGTEVELLNVPYVGKDKQLSPLLGIAAINTDLLEVVAFAAIKMTRELEVKTKAPGVSAADMATYREIAARLVVIVPAILGSLELEPLEKNIQGLLGAQATGSIQPAAFAEKLQSSTRSATRAVPAALVTPTLAALEQLAVNVSLDEATIAEMRALISVRLGIN